MNKALAYCAFLDRDNLSLPQSGVNGAQIQQVPNGELGLLWSQVDWPFIDSSLRRNAVQFHEVVTHMFSQGAVIPFRLLSVFDDLTSLAGFLAANHSGFIADLRRLQDVVQMECVLYLAPQTRTSASGREYLQGKAELLGQAEEFERSMRAALGALNQGMRRRESKNGSRMFVLVNRGDEKKFHSIVQKLAVPDHLARRTSGPWPAAEFLTESVRMPQSPGAAPAPGASD
jgi:hypothetical protein